MFWQGRREVQEGSQKVQISVIRKCWGCTVQQGNFSYHCYCIHNNVLKRVNPKGPHHSEKKKWFLLLFFLFFFGIYMRR